MDDIKQKILNYSIETIQNKGIKALTLQNITQNCHISRSTFYRCFDSKEALINEIHEISDEYDVHSTKEKILIAANEAFSKNTYPNIDIETIAKAVNMKRSSIYRYFPTKESLFEESLKMELESRREFYKKQDVYSMDFESALNLFFDYLSEFRKNDYKSLTFFNSLACAQQSDSVKNSLEALWKDTANILKKILQNGKDTGVLKQDFSADTYSQIIMSYIGGSSIFSLDNFETLKRTFIDLIYRELKS